MKVAIQGLAASYHALAAKQIFGDDLELIFCESFKLVFEALENHRADHAVVAIENSLYGSINEVYDLLLKHGFFITGEAYEHIGLHLLAMPGTQLEKITDVYSQAPALGEADVFLSTHLAKAERHEHSDTALAAKEVAQWVDETKAAIASQAAASEYGLEILASNIETHHQNYTRFVTLSHQQAMSGSSTKTSVTFQTADTPGSLYAALGVLAKTGANLTKLESRPVIGTAWKYMYYLDFTCDNHPKQLDQILEKLPSVATNIRILGTYESGNQNYV